MKKHLLIYSARSHICGTDIDECSVYNDSCHAQAFCNNTEGNFTCTCQSGYIGDGFNCKGNNYHLYAKSVFCVLFLPYTSIIHCSRL